MSEYLHAVLLLHSVKKEINEESIANVLKAAGTEPDMQRIKMIVSALSNVDIDKVLSSATSFLSAPASVAPTTPQAPQKAEEKPKEEKKEEKAEEVAGLGALFE